MVNWSGLPPAAGVAIYTFMVHSEAALVYQLMEVGYGHDKGVFTGFIGILMGYLWDLLGFIGILMGYQISMEFIGVGREVFCRPHPSSSP